ncbi:MAG TPA: RNA polymerase sigma factor [Deltaproteobacteria bacterium]|nr:RNA polymerase sigma factor [Deltaproteobacteria bacterium]
MGLERSDEALMVAFQKGDSAAFEELIRRHKNGVFNFIVRFLGNREVAEEVFQESFLKIHQASERYSPHGKFTTWLYTIVRNLCVDTFRRRKIRDAVSLDDRGENSERSLGEALAGSDVPADILSSASQIEAVLEQALEKLNEDQKEVFLLREKEGFKFEEIAEMTGVSVNTVKSRMRYALESLRRVLRQSKYKELLDKD